MPNKVLIERIRDTLITAANTQACVTEGDLCQTFKVSRGSVRDVLGHLETLGFIERRKNKGTFVRKPSLKELIELWDFRTAIESFAIRLACENIKENDCKELEDIIRKRRLAAEKHEGNVVVDQDAAFHLKIVELSENSFLKNSVENLHLFERLFKIYYVIPLFTVEDEPMGCNHEKILEALRSRNPDQAQQLLQLHIQLSKKATIERLLGRMNLFEKNEPT